MNKIQSPPNPQGEDMIFAARCSTQQPTHLQTPQSVDIRLIPNDMANKNQQLVGGFNPSEKY